MAEGYYLLIDGWKLNNGFDQIFLLNEPRILGIKKGESKMFTAEVRLGAFDAHFMNTYFKQTPILKIRLMKGNFLDNSPLIDPNFFQEQLEISHQTGQILFTFLDCRLKSFQDPFSTQANIYFANPAEFSYNTIVRNIPDIPKPTLPNNKPMKGKAVRNE
jgi:hypothetical protein